MQLPLVHTLIDQSALSEYYYNCENIVVVIAYDNKNFSFLSVSVRTYTHSYEFEDNQGSSPFVMKKFKNFVSQIEAADGDGSKLRQPLQKFVAHLGSMHVKTSQKILRNL